MRSLRRAGLRPPADAGADGTGENLSESPCLVFTADVMQLTKGRDGSDGVACFFRLSFSGLARFYQSRWAAVGTISQSALADERRAPPAFQAIVYAE